MSVESRRELAGKIAVVTGSSSGIGRAIVLELAAAGADCVVHAGHSQKKALSTADEVRQIGSEALALTADFAHSEQVIQFFDAAWNWRQQVGVWVNNAGVDTLTGERAGWDFERKLAALWQVDSLAAIRLSRLAGAKMKTQGAGLIINIGWDQAARGMAGDSGELFSTTKGAIMAFSKSLAQSLAPEVRVNCVAPGWIKTAWGESASQGWQKRATSECLLNRWGKPKDVANVVRFLASPAGEFLNGQVVEVNGGFRYER